VACLADGLHSAHHANSFDSSGAGTSTNAVTRAKDDFQMATKSFTFTASTPSPIPSSDRAALADPNWRAAMEDEYGALMSNGTWELVSRPRDSNIITGKWIFTHKLRADGSFDRYKARWVLRGFTQRPDVDYDETFSPVVKPATVRTVLSIAVSRDWPIQQLDVKNTFLHGTLTETVYCSQSTGFADPAHPDLVCRLKKSLYGLKQAPRAWYNRFASFLLSLGFADAKSNTSLFVFRRGSDTVYLLLYVDDIILTASSTELLRRTISALQWEFAMKDLGPLHHFLGITVERHPDKLFLHQRTYTLDILKRAVMTDCKPCSTLVDLKAKLAADSGPPVQDRSHFRSIAGALQYLTFTRPDIAYAVQQVCLHMHAPRESHLMAMKRILCYLRGMPDSSYVVRAPPTSSSTLMLTGPVVQTPAARLQATRCFWETTWCPGPPSDRPSSPAPVRRPSTAPSPTVWPRPPGCASCCWNFRCLRPGVRSSTATT
jgi:hypothetical protein